LLKIEREKDHFNLTVADKRKKGKILWENDKEA